MGKGKKPPTVSYGIGKAKHRESREGACEPWEACSGRWEAIGSGFASPLGEGRAGRGKARIRQTKGNARR